MTSIEADGKPVEVLTSFGPFRSFTLHSLAEAIVLDCTLCGEHQQVTLVATRNGTVACPWCFAHTVVRHKLGEPGDSGPAQNVPIRRYCWSRR